MQCSHCRTENEDSAKFCASCGAPMQIAPPPVCPVCAHVNAAGANFCIACGAHLRRRRTAPEAAHTANTVPSSAPGGEAAATRTAATTSRATPKPPISNPMPERARITPDLDAMRRPDAAAAAASARHEDFEGAAIRPPRISGFELKAGLAVLVLVLGGGLLWWSNQNDSRLAELALTAAAPASSALRTVAETAIGDVPPPQKHRMESEAVAAPPVSPVAAATPPTPAPVAVPDVPKVSEAPPAPKTRKHRSKSKREQEPEPEPAPVHVPAKDLPPVVELSAPASRPLRPVPQTEKRRSSLRDQVASCRRLSLFEGERCLWRICDGKWGKDGCPSYN